MPLPPLKAPAGLPERLWGTAKGLTASLLLFSTLIAFNLLQTASLLLKPFSSRAFRSANRAMADLWWGWCDKVAEHIYHIDVNVSGDEVPWRENALVVCNHQEMADITVLFRLARRKGRLGDLKFFVKDILKYVPGVGWGMLFIDCPFIKRNWTADREYLARVFRKILDNRIPLWLVSFVEGTRVKPRKIERSRAFALANGLKPLEHLLIPRTKGFCATVESLRGHLDAVYDVSIGYIEGVPTLWQWAKGYVKRVNVHVRRYAIATLPAGEDDLSAWLLRRFEEKDGLMDHYYRNGEFPAT